MAQLREPRPVPGGLPLDPEALYQFLVGRGRTWMIVHDLEGTIVLATEAAASSLEHEVGDLVGTSLAELAPADSRPVIDAYLHRMREEPTAEGLMVLSAKTGGRRRLSHRSVREAASGGRDVVLMTAVDVTELEAVREASERRIRSVLAVAAVAREISASLEPAVVARTIVGQLLELLGTVFAAVYRLDPRSGGLVRVAHTSEADTLPVLPSGEGVASLTVREAQPVVVDDVLADPRVVLSPGLRTRLEQSGVRAVLGVPLKAHGSTLGALVIGAAPGRVFSPEEMQLAETVAVNSAVALKNAELYADARERAAQYRTLLDGSIQGLLIHQDGIVVFVTRPFAGMLGYATPTELIGQSHLAVLAPDEHRRFEEHAGDLLAGKLVPSQVQFQARRKDGSYCWIEAVITLVSWQGKPAVMGTWVDISERRRAEAAYARATRELRSSQPADGPGVLTVGIVHEFTNALGIVTSNLEFVGLAGDHLPPDVSAALDRAGRGAQRGAELMAQLLAAPRPELLAPRMVSLNRVVTELETMLGRTLGPAITLERRSADELWAGRVDESQLATSLLNLVVNAREAMPSGGTLTLETANVSLDAEAGLALALPPGDYVAVTIADTGVGMPPDVLARASEPFFTTKASGQGSGLGLSMVDAFARRSGGTLTIASVPGRGTTVRLYLPRAEARVAREAASSAAGRPTVLVLEDEEDLRATVAMVLRRAGYRVLTAGTADEALTTLAGPEAVDVLFSDVVLPGGPSGPEVAERARVWRPDLKVLFASGYPPSALGALVSSSGLPLAKPYGLADLTRRLGELVPAVSSATSQASGASQT